MVEVVHVGQTERLDLICTDFDLGQVVKGDAGRFKIVRGRAMRDASGAERARHGSK
jgi:hypothetical protein